MTITDIERLERYVAMLRHECAYNGPCSDNGDGCICSAAELHNRKQSAALRQPSSPDGQTADGWIEWKGGECPVDPDVLVYYKTDDGTADGWAHTGTAWRAGGLQWGWNDTPPRGRIIAYRLIPALLRSGTFTAPAPLSTPREAIMGKPEDIPQEVWRAALMQVAGPIPVFPHDADYTAVADRVARWAEVHVAQAIRNERERCAAVALDYSINAEHRPIRNHTKAAHRSAAGREIAAAIRKGSD